MGKILTLGKQKNKMVLKSTRLIKMKKGKDRKRRTGTGDLVTAGVTALIGTALLTQTATLIRRI